MKFRCGKCNQFNEIPPGTGAGTDFISIACSHCNTLNRIGRQKTELSGKKKTNQSEERIPDSDKGHDPSAPGWIFVHDENTASQSFDLRPGVNIIGRKSSLLADVAIETKDSYMGRRHCMIEVVRKPGGGYSFLLSDFDSLNGTFINAQEKRRLQQGDVFYLKDGDTIQMGMTKVVIRVQNNVKKEEAEKEVNNSSYAPTVLVKR